MGDKTTLSMKGAEFQVAITAEKANGGVRALSVIVAPLDESGWTQHVIGADGLALLLRQRPAPSRKDLVVKLRGLRCQRLERELWPRGLPRDVVRTLVAVCEALGMTQHEQYFVIGDAMTTGGTR